MTILSSMRHLFFHLFFLFFIMTSTSHAITLQQTIEGISEYRLENGLRVLLIPDQSKPSTTVNMTYQVGSRHERYGQTGMAHLLEHMVFRGTENFPDALQSFSQRGLSANGSTNNDRTNYYAVFSSDPEVLEWYLRWQADTMQNIRVSEEDLKTEVGVVLNERERNLNNPFQTLIQRIQGSAYHWNNTGTATIGAPDDLQNMQAADLQAFYDNYYQPDNATLVVAGDFDEEETLALIDGLFAPIAKPTRQLIEHSTLEPTQDGERQVILRRSGGMPFIASAYHIPSPADERYVWLDLATQMLGERPSGHLYRQLVRDKQLVSSSFSTVSPHYATSLALFGAQLNDTQDIQKAQETLNQIVENLAEDPFTETELERVRTYWLSQWDKMYASTEHLAIGLSEAIAVGDWRLLFLERDRVKAAQLSDIQNSAEQFFVPSNRTSGQYIPTENAKRAPVIERPNVAALLENYQGDKNYAAIEAFDSSPANIQASTQRQTLNLANGVIKTALLAKPSRGQRVHANYRIKFSELDKLSHKASISAFAASQIMSGSQAMNQQEIHDRIDQLDGSLNYHISANQLVVSLSGTGANLPELLQLSLELIRQAEYPEAELSDFKNQVTRALQANSAEPGSKAMHALNEYLNPFGKEDLRYPMNIEEQIESIKSITREELLAFNRENFAAGEIDVSITGSFEPQAVLKVLEETISTWPKAPAYAYISDPYFDLPSKNFILETPDKANAVLIAKRLLAIQNNDPKFPALLIANHILGGSETSRLFKQVRSEHGLSYSVNSNVNASSFEPSAEWTVQAIFSPSKREEIVKVIRQTIQEARDKGFTEQELEQSKAAVLRMRALARAQDNVLSATWLRYLESGRDFTWNQTFEDNIRALKLEEVNQALREFLDMDQVSMALAGDFANAGADAEDDAKDGAKDGADANVVTEEKAQQAQ